MKPIPRKLALLMSVVGLGASFSEAAHPSTAASDGPAIFAARRLSTEMAGALAEPMSPGDHGADLVGVGMAATLDSSMRQVDDSVFAAATRGFGGASSDNAGVRSLKSNVGITSPSKAELEANALALVAIAEPASAWLPSTPTSSGSAAAPFIPLAPVEAPEPAPASAISLRQPEEPSAQVEPWAWVTALEPGAGGAEPESGSTLEAEAGDDASAAAPQSASTLAATSSSAEPQWPSGVQSELQEAQAPAARLPVPSPLSADGPVAAPPAASTALTTSSADGSTRTDDTARSTLNALEIQLLGQPVAMAIETAGPVDAPRLATASSAPFVDAAPAIELTTKPPRREASGVSCDAEPTAGATKRKSKWISNPNEGLDGDIVVTSHSDRVMRSLAALLSHEDPLVGRFGAQTQETVVASHAERALLTLAAVRADPDVQRARHAAAENLRSESLEMPLAEAAQAESARAEFARAEFAQPESVRAELAPVGDGLMALSESKLDGIRGGFQTDSGLQISFGIERAVYINGSLVTTTSLNVSSLGKVTAGSAQLPAGSATSGNLALVQNGAGNTFISGPAGAGSLGTVVQNTLNNQKIQSLTLINATVNSLQLIKAQNFQSSLRGALIDSLRR